MVFLHYMDKPLMNTLKAFINILLSAGNYSSNSIQFNLEQLNFPNSALFQRFSVENAVIHGNSRSQTSPEAAASQQSSRLNYFI